MVIYHTEGALPDVTRAYDPTADQKIVGSGNEDGYFPNGLPSRILRRLACAIQHTLSFSSNGFILISLTEF